MKKDNSDGRKSNSVCLVVACDAGFFPMVQGLVRSLYWNVKAKDLAGITLHKKFLDLNCTAEQLAWLNEHDFAAAKMHSGPAPTIPGAPFHYQAQTCRPYLPDYFPGYDVYVWLDADTWVQSPKALQELIKAAFAQKSALAAVQEVDPAYRIFHEPEQALAYYGDNDQRLRKYYPAEITEGLKLLPRFNDGVFAMHASSSYWVLWRTIMNDVLSKGYDYFHDQDSFNVAILLQKEVNILPAQYNWLCAMAASPVKNQKGKWCKPYAPYEELYLLHLIASGKKLSSGRTIGDFYRQRGLIFEQE